MNIKKKSWSNRSWTGEDSSFYQSRKWRAIRKKYVQENPVCELCSQFDIVSPGDICDHIISRKTSKELEFEPVNLQTLCASCHYGKTAQTRNIEGLKDYINQMLDGKLMFITPGNRKDNLIEYVKEKGLI
jgi:5-methylcytosine-specific restriction endonuclease McrA